VLGRFKGISRDLPGECRNAELLQLVSVWYLKAGPAKFQGTFPITVLQNWEITPGAEYLCRYQLLGAVFKHGYTY
jgi:hypothetical protein